ncbi:MAG TPA: nucleotidyltransferase family protein [Chitinophagaceae bacterium]|nr:nucleotidyltransferase family protein [Chitinophagaceae bacterium]
MINTYGIVVLAAGASVRLGKPKQLLEYEGKNLLQHVLDAAVNSDGEPVIVVLGANADLVAAEIDKSKVHVIKNSEWEQGMASSLRMGLKTLQKISPSVEGVIFMVCDQPHVSPELINELITAHIGSGKPIVTCNYGEAIGPPAFFHKSLFADLMKLKGDAGARKVIQLHSDEVATVLFTKGKIDIDTKEDYEALRNS